MEKGGEFGDFGVTETVYKSLLYLESKIETLILELCIGFLSQAHWKQGICCSMIQEHLCLSFDVKIHFFIVNLSAVLAAEPDNSTKLATIEH